MEVPEEALRPLHVGHGFRPSYGDRNRPGPAAAPTKLPLPHLLHMCRLNAASDNSNIVGAQRGAVPASAHHHGNGLTEPGDGTLHVEAENLHLQRKPARIYQIIGAIIGRKQYVRSGLCFSA